MSKYFIEAISAVFAHNEEEAKELIRLLTPEEVAAGMIAIKKYEVTHA